DLLRGNRGEVGIAARFVSSHLGPRASIRLDIGSGDWSWPHAAGVANLRERAGGQISVPGSFASMFDLPLRGGRNGTPPVAFHNADSAEEADGPVLTLGAHQVSIHPPKPLAPSRHGT